MSLTAMNLLQSARRKYFMNSTYIMSRKKDSNVLGLRRQKGVLQPRGCSNRRGKFFMNSTYMMSRK